MECVGTLQFGEKEWKEIIRKNNYFFVQQINQLSTYVYSSVKGLKNTKNNKSVENVFE